MENETQQDKHEDIMTGFGNDLGLEMQPICIDDIADFNSSIL